MNFNIHTPKFIVYIVLLCNTLIATSQDTKNNAYFDHLGTDDGLSQNDVNCIYQDNQGLMWFGTHDGLNRYDGYNFKIYRPESGNPKSINSNLIYALTGDANGNLWVGTSGYGLNQFNKKSETFTHYTHDPENSKSLSNNQITNLLVDSKNRLWVATLNGINLAYLNKNKPINFEHFELTLRQRKVTSAHCIFEDSKKQIWLGTNRGLFKLNDSTEDGKKSFSFVAFGYSQIRSINENRFGKLLVSVNNKVHSLDVNTSSNNHKLVYTNASNASFNDILIHKGIVWVGAEDGLYKFKSEKDSTLLINKFTYHPQEENSLSKNIIRALYLDKTENIWIGTNGGGINKYDPNRKRFKHLKSNLNKNSLSYDKIRAIFEDSNNNLWFGTEGGELNMLPKEKANTFENGFIKFPNIKNIFAIEEIKRNGKNILLLGGGSNASLYQLDITNPNNITQINNPIFYNNTTGRIFSILKDKSENLWIGSYNQGILRWTYDKNFKSYKKDVLSHSSRDNLSVSDNIIRNILEDKNGNLWFATGKGLSKLSKEEKYKNNPKFEIFKHNPKDTNSISHDYILELFESNDGTIWIGTFGGGINKYIPPTEDTPAKFISFKADDGLPNDVVKGILEDDSNNLWISTNRGLTKFNPENETFKNYDVNDGLQDNEFQEVARIKRKNGELVFGGINGFNVFNPQHIKDNPIEAETIITGLSIFNKPIKVGDTINDRVLLKSPVSNTNNITLKYKENSFSFEFAALHYSAPQKNNFLYMLEGFDEDWIYTDSNRRFATYTNLSPNTYILKVKASNNDNVWDSTPSTIKITIERPHYLTKFAFLIYALIFLGLLMLYRRFTIIKTSKKHALELEHIEREKNEELQRIKLEFFTNITHEFTTPLTLIQGPLKHLKKQGDKLDEAYKQEQYKLMQKNTDYLLRLISQLLDFRKINQGKMRLVMRNGNIVDFIKEVSEPFQFMARKQHIAFNINAENNSIQSWFDHDAIEKIINNLLSNAFKFTPESGIITINISSKGTSENTTNALSHVIIKVKDSGRGMDDKKVKNIFKRFFSEKNEDRKDAKGMGIGLAYVKSLVKLHQGSINVDSKIGSGTTFTVKLPREKKAYVDIPEITCKDLTESDFHIRSSESDSLAISINDEIVDKSLNDSNNDTPTLLVVDDNEDIRTFIKQALGQKYNVYTAENGAIAVELLQNISPKVVITDIMMPVMDGIELCEHIKTKKETSHIPVIMLTAKLSQENEITGLKTGADSYIRKPFDIELLELKISNILKHRQELRNKFNLDITLQPKEITVTSLDERFLNQAIEIVEKHMMNTDFNVEMLLKEMGYSRTNLYKKFKETTGLSSSEFIRNIRLKRAVQLFNQSDLSVKEIMYMTGFNTSSYFAKCFKKQFGVKPSEYVRQNKAKSQL